MSGAGPNPFGHGVSLEGIRIVQVPAGTVIGGEVVSDTQGVQDARGTICVTAKHYEAIKASAREAGQVTYSHR